VCASGSRNASRQDGWQPTTFRITNRWRTAPPIIPTRVPAGEESAAPAADAPSVFSDGSPSPLGAVTAPGPADQDRRARNYRTSSQHQKREDRPSHRRWRVIAARRMAIYRCKALASYSHWNDVPPVPLTAMDRIHLATARVFFIGAAGVYVKTAAIVPPPCGPLLGQDRSAQSVSGESHGRHEAEGRAERS
jgi:hypothetical protein